MKATAALSGLLASAQVVFANFTFVHFSGSVSQCGPLSVNFTGGQLPAALPLTITVVPFFARPLSIPVSLASWDDIAQAGSATVDFLPLDAGAQFVASLDDADGNALGLVSDVLEVGGSNETFCLPAKPANGHGRKDSDSDDDDDDAPSSSSNSNFYGVKGNLNQCAQFNVSFNRSLSAKPPTIRAFLPRSISYFVNTSHAFQDRQSLNNTNSSTVETSKGRSKPSGKKPNSTDDDKDGDDDDDDDDDDDGENGKNENTFQPYVLNVEHGQQVVLLFNDSRGHAETSPLITVGGDVNSPRSCFQTLEEPISSTKTATKTGTISNSLKIIIAVSSSVIVVLIGAFMVFIIRRKRLHLLRGHVRRSMSFNFTEDISMGTGSFVDRVCSRFSRFLSSPLAMSPRAPLISTKAKSFNRLSDFNEKDDVESGRSASGDANSMKSLNLIEKFPKVPSPARPKRSSTLYSFGDVEKVLDRQFHHPRAPSKTLQLKQQPRVPIIVTPPPRARSNPDAPRPAVPGSPSILSTTRYSSRSSVSSSRGSPSQVLRLKAADETSSFFDSSSILSSSNFVPISSRVGVKADRRV